MGGGVVRAGIRQRRGAPSRGTKRSLGPLGRGPRPIPVTGSIFPSKTEAVSKDAAPREDHAFRDGSGGSFSRAVVLQLANDFSDSGSKERF